VRWNPQKQWFRVLIGLKNLELSAFRVSKTINLHELLVVFRANPLKLLFGTPWDEKGGFVTVEGRSTAERLNRVSTKVAD
jgi:hypothetical protein